MRTIIPLTLVAVVMAVAAQPVTAQQAEPEDTTIAESLEDALDRGGLHVALDSIAQVAGPGLQDALDEVVAEIAVVAQRIATDRELRLAAVRTAEGVIEVAQAVLEERSGELQEALREMADRLENLDGTDGDPSPDDDP